MLQDILVRVGADISGLSSELKAASADMKTFGNTSTASFNEAAAAAGIYEDANGRLRKANGQFVSDAEKMALGLDTAGGSLKKFGENMSEVGGMIAKTFGAATLAITGGLTYAVKSAADFDTQIRKAGAIAGASAEELDAMRDSAIKLGASTSESASSVAVAKHIWSFT